MVFLDVLKPKGVTKNRANTDVENAEKAKEGSGQIVGNTDQDVNIY